MISPVEYKIVADQIAELQLIDETSIEYVNFLKSEVNDLSSLNEPVDSIKTIINSINTTLNSRFTTETSISRLVLDLQIHILNNTIYTDINDYLRDFEMKVKPLFADVSERVGFLINDSNILGSFTQPVPNVLAWAPKSSSDHDFVKAVWEEYLELGFNTLPMDVHHIPVQNPLTVQSDDPYIDNWLTVQSELGGLPFQMLDIFGYRLNWDGQVAGPTIYRRGDPGSVWDPGDPLHYSNYHTNVEAAILSAPAFGGYAAGTFEALVSANWPEMIAGGNFSGAAMYLHCPNSRATTAYVNALAKLNEYCKWLKPCAVHFDNEFYVYAVSADYAIGEIVGDINIGLSTCTRCGGENGYINGVDAIGSDLSSIVRSHSVNPVIVQYNVFTNNLVNRNKKSFWAFNRSTGFIIGNPPLYRVTYDYTGVVGVRTVYTTNLVDRLLQLRDGSAPEMLGVPYPQAQSEAISGSYPYLCQRLDVYDYTRGYVSSEEFYDLCYKLAGDGAFGFALYPGYSGKDKDPITYPPHTASYTTATVMDDIAARRLYPVGIQAFIDYQKKYTVQPLPTF